MKFIWILLFFFSLVFSSFKSVLAQEQPVICDGKDTAIFYVNGIMNTKKEAKENLNELKDSLFQKVSTGQLTQAQFDAMEFDIAYNPSAGLMRDLTEALANKLEESVETVWTFAWEIVLSVPEALTLIDEEIKNDILTKVTAATVGLVINPDDLGNHLAKYRNSHLQGKKVIMVSHSQGNFFANAAFDVLEAESQQEGSTLDIFGFGIVSVATPAGTVAVGNRYSTFDEDKVIEAVRVATLPPGLVSPLPSNVAFPQAQEDSLDAPLHHNFINAYMSPLAPAREKILLDFIITYTTLVQPFDRTGNGILTVMLTTNLVFSGTFPIQVSVPEGASSVVPVLISSDTQRRSSNPVTYWIIHTWLYSLPCQLVQPGIYTIDTPGSWVNNERVTIRAGPEEQTFQYTFKGGANQPPLAEVDVTDPSGNGNIADYQYKIRRTRNRNVPGGGGPP